MIRWFIWMRFSRQRGIFADISMYKKHWRQRSTEEERVSKRIEAYAKKDKTTKNKLIVIIGNRWLRVKDHMGGREILLLFAIDEASSPLVCERCSDDGLNNLTRKRTRDRQEGNGGYYYLLLCNVIWSVLDWLSEGNVFSWAPPKEKRRTKLALLTGWRLAVPFWNIRWEKNLTKRSP